MTIPAYGVYAAGLAAALAIAVEAMSRSTLLRLALRCVPSAGRGGAIVPRERDPRS